MWEESHFQLCKIPVQPKFTLIFIKFTSPCFSYYGMAWTFISFSRVSPHLVPFVHEKHSAFWPSWMLEPSVHIQPPGAVPTSFQSTISLYSSNSSGPLSDSPQSTPWLPLLSQHREGVPILPAQQASDQGVRVLHSFPSRLAFPVL